MLVLGHTKPRVFTKPLDPHSPGHQYAGLPKESFGYEVIDFARDVLKSPLDEWEEEAVIRGGELLPGGLRRFTIVLIIAARRNGKTHIAKVLTLYWQFKKQIPLTIITSTDLPLAIEVWKEGIDLADACPELNDDHEPDEEWHRHGGALGHYSITKHGAKVSPRAPTTKAGRGGNVHRALLDELRLHLNYACWSALTYAGGSVRDFQAWATTNAGSERSIVLNDLHKGAIEYIESGGEMGDSSVCLLEWSCERGDDPLNPEHLAKANPNMNRHGDDRGPWSDDLIKKGKAAIVAGGPKLAEHLTEAMCLSVPSMNPAYNPEHWKLCADPGMLLGVVRNLAMCLDIAPGNRHAALIVAGVLPDGRVRAKTVKDWDGVRAVDSMRRELNQLLVKFRPRVLGWLPGGPGATFMADAKKLALPAGTELVPIQGELAAVCMSLEEQINSHLIAHDGSNDELLSDHVLAAEKRERDDGTWVIGRKGGVCEGAYALAGAVYLARTLPAPLSMTLPTPGILNK